MTSADVASYLAQRKALVDMALDARLPAASVEPRRVHDAMRYAVLAGGKRLRPILTLAVGELSGQPPEAVLDAACALELVHTASLVLDDLPAMDNGQMRRGQPCTHITFSEDTAILAVMGLVALAFEWTARNGEAQGGASLVSAVVRRLARAMGTAGIVGGQHVDLRESHDLSSEHDLELMYEQKAGALFLASVEIPAALVGLPPCQVQTLVRFARSIGLAFQVTDDLLDEQATPQDALKSNFVTQLGRKRAKRRAEELVAAAHRELEPFGESAWALREVADFVKSRTV